MYLHDGQGTRLYYLPTTLIVAMETTVETLSFICIVLEHVTVLAATIAAVVCTVKMEDRQLVESMPEAL